MRATALLSCGLVLAVLAGLAVPAGTARATVTNVAWTTTDTSIRVTVDDDGSSGASLQLKLGETDVQSCRTLWATSGSGARNKDQLWTGLQREVDYVLEVYNTSACTGNAAETHVIRTAGEPQPTPTPWPTPTPTATATPTPTPAITFPGTSHYFVDIVEEGDRVFVFRYRGESDWPTAPIAMLRVNEVYEAAANIFPYVDLEDRCIRPQCINTPKGDGAGIAAIYVPPDVAALWPDDAKLEVGIVDLVSDWTSEWTEPGRSIKSNLDVQLRLHAVNLGAEWGHPLTTNDKLNGAGTEYMLGAAPWLKHVPSDILPFELIQQAEIQAGVLQAGWPPASPEMLETAGLSALGVATLLVLGLCSWLFYIASKKNDRPQAVYISVAIIAAATWCGLFYWQAAALTALATTALSIPRWEKA